MKNISIYIATTIPGRWNRDGYIGYTLEYYPEHRKYPETKEDYVYVENMNKNRAELKALYLSFTRIRENCVVSIYTDSDYIYKTLEKPGYLEQWIKNGWMTARGTEVKNRDLWQQLEEKMQGNLCKVYLREPNAYTERMKEKMEEKKIL